MDVDISLSQLKNRKRKKESADEKTQINPETEKGAMPKLSHKQWKNLKFRQWKERQFSVREEKSPFTQKAVWTGKSNVAHLLSPNTYSCLTLDRESIEPEKPFGRFWNESKAIKSKQLWLPMRTDSFSAYSRKSLARLPPNSVLKIRKNAENPNVSPALSFSLAVSAGKEETETKKAKPTLNRKPKVKKIQNEKRVMRCQKIKLRIPDESLPFLRKWNQACIDTWNLCLQTMKKLNIDYQKPSVDLDNIRSLLACHCRGAHPVKLRLNKPYQEIQQIKEDFKNQIETLKSEQFPQYFSDGKKRKKLTLSDEQKAEINQVILKAGFIYDKQTHGKIILPMQGGLSNTKFAYLLETPKDIRARIIDSMIASIKSSRTRTRNLWTLKTSNSKIKIPDWKLHPKVNEHGNAFIPLPGSHYGGTRIVNQESYSTELQLFPRFGNIRLFTMQKVRDDERILDWKLLQQKGQWYACMPFERIIDTTTEHIEHRQEIASLDPGLRTLQTVYSPDGMIMELGNNLSDKVKRIQIRCDQRSRHLKQLKKSITYFRKLPEETKITELSELEQSKINIPIVKNVQFPKKNADFYMTHGKPRRRFNEKKEYKFRGLVRENEKQQCQKDLMKKVQKRYKQKRYRMKKALKRLRARQSNIVDGHHYAYIHFLCANFRNILIPRFSVKSMIANKPRIGEDGKLIKKSVLSKRTKQVLVALKHFSFRQRLIQKSSEYPNTNIWIATEEYTSKTCGKCGTLHQKLGGSKVFKCPNPECDMDTDRDWNGARNVLLKCMT